MAGLKMQFTAMPQILEYGVSSSSKMPDGSCPPRPFYSKKLEGLIQHGPQGEALGFTGQ